MTFGRADLFAIEVYSERMADAPAGVWGRACLHVQGSTIGDIAEPHCGLDAFADAMTEMVAQLDSPTDIEFASCSDTEVFRFLDLRLYGDIGQPQEEMKRDWGRFGRFDFLTNVGEQFDGWKTFIFTRADGSVRIVSSRDGREPESHAVPRSEIIAVTAAFLAWFEAQRQTASR